MSSKTKYFTLFLMQFFLLISIGTTALWAQNATITGYVTDEDTEEPLPGANVVIEGTSMGDATNLKGFYEIPGVPPGNYTLKISYIGYNTKEIEINVQPGQEIEKDVALQYGARVKGEEVTVTAQASGQLDAINQQLTSRTIKNVVSSEKIRELPDANAAESIGRLPGVSLQRSSGEGNKIVVRGLSPKYNNVTVEGVKLPSSNFFDRSVDLNMISSEMLSGIELTKSLTPDMDADAHGGTVNLTLREAPEGLHFSGKANGGYNDLNQSFANGKINAAISNRFLDNKLGAYLQLNYEKKQLPSHRMGGSYSNPEFFIDRNEQGAVVDSGFNFYTTGANLILRDEVRDRYGGSLIMDYETDNVQIKFYNFYNQLDSDVLTRNNNFAFTNAEMPFQQTITDLDATTLVQTHSLQNTFQFLNTDLKLNFSYTKSDQDAPALIFNLSDAESASAIDKSTRLYAKPEVIIDKYRISKVQEGYLGSIDRRRQNLIDENINVDASWSVPYKLYKNVSGNFKIGGKYHEKNRDSDRETKFADFKWGNGELRQQHAVKLFPWIKRGNEVGIRDKLGLPAVNFVDQDWDPGQFLKGRYNLGWTADPGVLRLLGNTMWQEYGNQDFHVDGVPTYQNTYSATEELAAGYIMTELNFGDKLTLIPGVRYEKVNTSYTAFHVKTQASITGIATDPDTVTTTRENEFFFPSLNVRYKLYDWFQIKAATYKSIARPSFAQISPMVIYFHAGNYMWSNNPFLKPSPAWNYDLGFSVSNNQVGLFTVNLYYKEIEDLIFGMSNYFPSKIGLIQGAPKVVNKEFLGPEYYDPVFLKSNYFTNLPLNNPETAFNKGIELSWQTNLWYLPGLLQNIVLDLNVSFIDSQADYPFLETRVVDYDSSGFVPQPIYGYFYQTRKDELVDQPAQIFNIRLGWDYKGFSSRISFRYQDRTINSVDAKYNLKDQIREQFFRYDLSIKQNITEQLQFYANFANINEHVDEEFLAVEKTELPTNREFYGFTSQFGLRYEF